MVLKGVPNGTVDCDGKLGHHFYMVHDCTRGNPWDIPIIPRRTVGWEIHVRWYTRVGWDCRIVKYSTMECNVILVTVLCRTEDCDGKLGHEWYFSTYAHARVKVGYEKLCGPAHFCTRMRICGKIRLARETTI